jgi:hypothetical protein
MAKRRKGRVIGNKRTHKPMLGVTRKMPKSQMSIYLGPGSRGKMMRV